LERFRAVEYVLRNRCVKHKAEEDNPEHQPTISTKCDAEYSKEEPDLRRRIFVSTTIIIPYFGLHVPWEVWKDVSICAQYF
jgi:hypothetical protein